MREEPVVLNSPAILAARVMVGVLGIPTLLGVVWFAESLSHIELITGTVLGTCSLLSVLVPGQTTASPPMIMRMVYVAGILSGVVLVLLHLNAIGGIEIDVVVANLVHVLSFLFLLIGKKPDIQGQTPNNP
jgi:hypothetical protein